MTIPELKQVINTLKGRQRRTMYVQERAKYAKEIARAEHMIKEIENGTREASISKPRQ